MVDGQNVVEVGPSCPWKKHLPIVKDAKQVHGHLHNKTHFKSTHTFFLQPDSDKVDLEDREVCNMIKDIQKVVSKKRKSALKAAMLKMLSKKMPLETSS